MAVKVFRLTDLQPITLLGLQCRFYVYPYHLVHDLGQGVLALGADEKATPLPHRNR